MPGLRNPAFEANELDEMESGRTISTPIKRQEQKPEKSSNYLVIARTAVRTYTSKHRRAFKFFSVILGNVAVVVYLIFASIYWRKKTYHLGFNWCDGYGMLLLLLGFTYAGIIYYCVVKRYFGKCIGRSCRPFANCTRSLQGTRCGAAVVYSLIFLAIIVFLIFDTIDSPERLKSGVGVVILLALGWLFSKYPASINWRPVLCGLILQFVFGLITIRWAVGRAIFQCIGQKVATFLDFALEGAKFIFSDYLVGKKIFAFTVLPVIFYFSFMIQILYYLGTMQWIIMKLGWLLQTIMGTTLCESITCAANTFIGMSESPLLIKPYLNKLTASELHTIMCSGFASVSGTVLAAYIGFGAEPAHLITASIMSAPAALCYSKLFYPETQQSLTTCSNIQLEKSKDSNIMDAASKGALAAIPLVLGIIANIIAFVSFIAFINALLGWLGYLIGFQALSFELILSKVFMPLSWIMGVPWDECEDVATLIGLKTIVNEFIAYESLGKYKAAGKLSGRTEGIATYAICGFANPSSVGIMIGMLTSLAPEKRKDITGAVVRAFIAGSAVCFLTASIAGLLMDDGFFQTAMNTLAPNTTTTTTPGYIANALIS